jgi:hypothetical protein
MHALTKSCDVGMLFGTLEKRPQRDAVCQFLMRYPIHDIYSQLDIEALRYTKSAEAALCQQTRY